MEFRDLKRQYQELREQMDSAVLSVMDKGQYIGGSPVIEFEKDMADYVGVKHAISCANGTDALMMALMVLGVGEGDAVFVPDFTFFATAEAPAFLGATPILVDVDEETFNLDPAALQAAIDAVKTEGSLKPSCIIPVDLFGLPADYEAIESIAKAEGLYVLEDAAQGFGGELNGRRACAFGDIAITSFFPAKPLGCYGDGGMLFTNNDQYAELLDSLKVHGKGSFKYDNVRIGVNSRLDTLQAAILSVKFDAFKNYELAATQEVAKRYDQLLTDAKITEDASIPLIPVGYLSSWAQYTLKFTSNELRDKVQEDLKGKGIPTMVYYPTPLHRQPALAPYLAHTQGSLDRTIRLTETVLSLPFHPYMTEEEQEEVVAALSESLR